MLGAEEPYGPVSYSSTWLILGLVVAAVALALLAWAWLPRRERAAAVAPIAPLRRPPLGQVQARYLDRLDAEVRRYRAGEHDDRELHHELSRIVRGFVGEAEGLHAEAMTPNDLNASGMRSAAAAVYAYWDPQFREENDSTPEASIAAARHLITTWAQRRDAAESVVIEAPAGRAEAAR